ncbi:Fic family protein, partial [bacterium]|nr:Fic family protein [bacterium]
MFDPASIKITREILNLIAGIDEFKGRWEAMGRLAPDTISRLRKVATIESVGSSTRIEGARLSDAQVEALLAGLEPGSFRTRDEEEVAGYAEAMNTVFGSWDRIPMDENHIKQLHGILLKFSSADEPHRGEYKKQPNHVEAFDPEGGSLGIVFETASPFETPLLMEELVPGIASELEKGMLHPLLVIAAFIVHFLAIHPFKDGNGRLSRILTTLLLLRCGYRYVPYASMERIVEDSKDGYYRALRSAQRGIRTSQEDLGEWVLFFLRTLDRQVKVLTGKIEQEKVLEVLPALSEQLLGIARDRGRLTISEAVKMTGANRNTVKVHL